jgi:hypothetical protein
LGKCWDAEWADLINGLSCKELSVYTQGCPPEVAITGKVVVGLIYPVVRT